MKLLAIPAIWRAEYDELLRLFTEQARKEYVWTEGETPVTDDTFRAFGEKTVTAEELAQLEGLRGQYRLGDTRTFVIFHESECLAFNCWMVRSEDGSVASYVSEAPVL